MITGKVVWVTGASSGIGLALVQQLLADGNQVIASARGLAALAPLAQQYGQRLSLLSCDLACAESMAAAGTQLAAITDHLDLAILNAGTCEYIDLPAFQADVVARVFAVNVVGTARCIEIALPLLRRAHRGVLAVVSSLSALVAFPRAEAYGASKAALDYMLDALAIDLRASPVTVTVIRPGFVATPLTAQNDFPMPAMVSPERAAREILSAAEQRKAWHGFPRRLAWPLMLMRSLAPFWRRFVAPALVRSNSNY